MSRDVIEIAVAVFGALIAAGLLYGLSRWRNWHSRETVVVEIATGGVVLPASLRIGLLFVRDGEGPPVSRELFFEPGPEGTSRVRVRSTAAGFEYKCFADHGGVAFEEAEAILSSLGMEHVTRGRGRPNRAWFLRPGQKVVATDAGHSNNFFYVR